MSEPLSPDPGSDHVFVVTHKAGRLGGFGRCTCTPPGDYLSPSEAVQHVGFRAYTAAAANDLAAECLRLYSELERATAVCMEVYAWFGPTADAKAIGAYHEDVGEREIEAALEAWRAHRSPSPEETTP